MLEFQTFFNIKIINNYYKYTLTKLCNNIKAPTLLRNQNLHHILS